MKYSKRYLSISFLISTLAFTACQTTSDEAPVTEQSTVTSSEPELIPAVFDSEKTRMRAQTPILEKLELDSGVLHLNKYKNRPEIPFYSTLDNRKRIGLTRPVTPKELIPDGPVTLQHMLYIDTSGRVFDIEVTHRAELRGTKEQEIFVIKHVTDHQYPKGYKDGKLTPYIIAIKTELSN